MTARYESFAEQRFDIGLRSGDEWMVRCVFHDSSKYTMQFNVELGVFICFHGDCLARGNIKTLERHLGVRASEDTIDVADIYARLDSLKKEEEPPLPVLGESYLKQFAFPTKYWESRGFEKSTIESFDLGYSPMGDHIGGEFVTIPIRDVRGQLLGVIKRYLDPNIDLRYRYPKGFKKAQHLFASWLAEQDPDAHTVVLVEGSLDAIKVWQAGWPALAIYGSHVSEAQIRLLKRMGVRKTILFFDNDKAGKAATSAALGFKRQLVREGQTKREVTTYDPSIDLRREFLVRQVRYRLGVPGDPGAMDNETIDFLLRKSRKVM